MGARKMQNYERFIATANRMADEIPPRPYLFVAFAIVGSRVLGVSSNIYKTHPISLQHPYMLGAQSTLHAEASAILQVKPEYRSRLELVVVRIPRDRSRGVAPARPCSGCLSLIEESNISKVTYTIAPGEWGTIYPGRS